MTIIVRKAANVTVVDLVGPLTMGKPVQTFRDQIQDLLAGGTNKLAINLVAVPDLDSSGVGALVAGVAAIKAGGGKCKFFAAPERIVQVLKRAHLDVFFDLMGDEAAAVSSLGPGNA